MRSLLPYWPLILVGCLAVPIMVADGWMQANARTLLAQALPGFACDGMVVKASSSRGSWGGSWRSVSGSLTLPPPCRRTLSRALADGRWGYRPANCDDRGRCYRSEDGSLESQIVILPERTLPYPMESAGSDAYFRVSAS